MSSQKEAATATTTATTTTTNATSSKKITDPYQYVQKAYNEFQENSKLKRRADIPAITKADVTIQETLGTGGFADVKACTFQGRECALKTLKPAMLAAPAATFAIAAADLMKEAEFLAAIDHDNICSIYATHMSSVSNEALKNNFFVLERIDCTMDDRMDEWRVLDSKAITQQKPKARKHLLYDRLRVCLDIANTLKYLHDENVIYRDLKAANLGFDAEGNVKLFGKSTLLLLLLIASIASHRSIDCREDSIKYHGGQLFLVSTKLKRVNKFSHDSCLICYFTHV